MAPWKIHSHRPPNRLKRWRWRWRCWSDRMERISNLFRSPKTSYTRLGRDAHWYPAVYQGCRTCELKWIELNWNLFVTKTCLWLYGMLVQMPFLFLTNMKKSVYTRLLLKLNWWQRNRRITTQPCHDWLFSLQEEIRKMMREKKKQYIHSSVRVVPQQMKCYLRQPVKTAWMNRENSDSARTHHRKNRSNNHSNSNNVNVNDGDSGEGEDGCMTCWDHDSW